MLLKSDNCQDQHCSSLRIPRYICGVIVSASYGGLDQDLGPNCYDGIPKHEILWPELWPAEDDLLKKAEETCLIFDFAGYLKGGWGFFDRVSRAL